MKKVTGIFLSCLFIKCVSAEPSQAVLPDPLSLDYALSLAKDSNYADIISVRSLQDRALSEIEQAESSLAMQASLKFEAALIQPSPLAKNQDSDDHSAVLKINKPLYDFGQSGYKEDAAEAEFTAIKNTMDFVFDQRRIDIARRFFDVILSDLKYAWDTESTVVAYVHNESVKDRHALGEVSDVELFKSNDDHQVLFHKRAVTESKQRITRAMLAEVLNMPGMLSSNLKIPHLEYHNKILPEYNVLLEKLMQKNVQIRLQKTRVDSAHKKLLAARHQMRPLLSAEVEVAEYSRDSALKEDWRAALNLTFPLLEHAGVKAEVSRQRSNWLEQRAKLLSAQSQFRQRLYELWQEIHLLKSERLLLIQSMSYRELKLDQSRALYELEVETDLGDAMIAISEMRYKQAVTDFKLALSWMELLMMLDENIVSGDLAMREI